MNKRKFQCSSCENIWEVPYGTSRPAECPKCKSTNIHRADENKGYNKHNQGRHRHGRRGRNS